MKIPPLFERHVLKNECDFWVGRLPEELVFTHAQFEQLWQMHPLEYHEIRMLGRPVKTPRWQQAYGKNYEYTGQVNKALPIPPLLNPLLAWAKTEIEESLNGLLLNWYDGSLGHYIGPHHDSIKNMAHGAPIVTISFGEERIFRLRPSGGHGLEKGATLDFRTASGTVFVMPYDTNLAVKHEVPASAKYRGRRVSVTIRAFVS